MLYLKQEAAKKAGQRMTKQEWDLYWTLYRGSVSYIHSTYIHPIGIGTTQDRDFRPLTMTGTLGIS